jgi:hypothetical protein
MQGYCGRAPAVGGVRVNAAGVTSDVAAGARAYAVRRVALMEARRHLVVRIGPRPTGGPTANGIASPAGGEGNGETRARAA